VFNPVFDVTPADLIDVIVTGSASSSPDTAKLAQLICRKRLH
jgi:methylthioribose-1-phosphate isomerase